MHNISLSIPFLVLSTEMKISGEMEKHLLTPFGYVDIILPGEASHAREGLESEIQVVGDIDSWMLDESLPVEFRHALLGFVEKIARGHLGYSPVESGRRVVRFRGRGRDVRFSRHGAGWVTTS